MKREYYWFKTNGETKKISESVFYFLLEKHKHTLIQVADGKIVFNQGEDNILIREKQLKLILK